MSRWHTKKAAVREHPGVVQRRNRVHMLAMITDPAQKARYLSDFPEDKLIPLPKPRAKRQPRGVDIDAVHGEDLEASVISSVSELLSTHPRVLFAVRQNTGAMPYDRGGRPVPVWFYKFVRKPDDMTISDFWGLLRDGKPFAFEAKRPSWEWKATDRETRQRAFLDMIETIGGVAAFVTSATDVQKLLETA